MELFVAADLIDNKCVRLSQGEYDKVTEFGDPIETVGKFVEQGVTHLHIVDLMAAKTGEFAQLKVVEKIRNKFEDLFIQYGGGVRDSKRVMDLANVGINRMVISTAAITDVDFTIESIFTYRNKIALGFDTKNLNVAVNGWTQKTTLKIEDALNLYSKYEADISAVIVTDIAKDGMMSGPNLTQLKSVLDKTEIPLIASGGISTTDDILKLKDIKVSDKKVSGIIVGMAIYSGSLDLNKALELCTR